VKLTKEQAAENRRQILETAARLFRERGFDGVGVADLMKAAGFTHGGFYNHFASKEALAEEACGAALEGANGALAESLEGRRGAFAAYLAQYLSPAHRDDPATGCTLAALSADAGRQGKDVQARFAAALEEVIELTAAELAPRRTRAARAQALQLWSEAIGALVLSRAVVAADPALSDEILAAARDQLLP
jgi:TetR/AcrR family transcriptional repressor of nem operon